MPPHVKSRWVPRLNGLKLRVNAWSPEPAATTHGCALAVDLAGRRDRSGGEDSRHDENRDGDEERALPNGVLHCPFTPL